MRSFYQNSIIVLLICLTIAYLFPNWSNALGSYSKSESNPLIVHFNEEYSELMQSHIFKGNDKYRGLFSLKSTTNNKYNIVLCESNDGINWDIIKTVLSSDTDLFAPRLLELNDGINKIYYTKHDFDKYRIYSVDCDSNYDCGEKTLLFEPTDSYESNGSFSAFPFINNDKKIIFYGVWGLNGFSIRLLIEDSNGEIHKCSTEIVSSADSPFIVEEDNKFVMYYHQSSGGGINHVYTEDEDINCLTSWNYGGNVITKGEDYDFHHIISPSVINSYGKSYLYYSGLGSAGWSLNLAIRELEKPKTKTVIIPGMFASWNKDAVLHETFVDLFSWELNPMVDEYNGIVESLVNAGYQQNTDLFVFNYDWRNSIETTAENLNAYAEQNIFTSNPNEKIDLVGHSLGGLIARVYAQKYPNKVNKVVTVGSPHKGAAPVYKALAGGELETTNSIEYLAQKLMLQLYKNTIQTDREVINTKLPVLKDLFPTYSFLLNENMQTIDISNMTIENILFTLLNQDYTNISDKLVTLAGAKTQTTHGYKTKLPTKLDKLLGNYVDGRPIENIYDQGDNAVLKSSALFGTNKQVLDLLDHGEIIYKKEGIKKIMDSLEISYNEAEIIEGSKTNLFPSLLFLVLSPVELQVQTNGNVYTENQGLIFIPNPISGEYLIKATGKEPGKFSIIIYYLSNEKEVWKRLEGEVASNNPTEQEFNYVFNLNTSTNELTFNKEDLLLELITYLNILNETVNNKNIDSAAKELIKLQKSKNLNKQNYIRSILDKTHTKLFNARKEVNNTTLQNSLLNAVQKLEDIYPLYVQSQYYKKYVKTLEQKLTKANFQLRKAENFLTGKKNVNRNIKANAVILQLAWEKYYLAKTSLENNSLSAASILLRTVNRIIPQLN